MTAEHRLAVSILAALFLVAGWGMMALRSGGAIEVNFSRLRLRIEGSQQ